MIDAVDDVGVLDARAEPHVREDLADLGANKSAHSLRAFGEYLIMMVRRGPHDGPHFQDKGVRHPIVEQVGHRVDEYLSGLLPTQRNIQRRLVLANDAIPNGSFSAATRKPPIFWYVHRLKTSCHFHGVAIRATGADDGTACNRIPGGIGPFNLCLSHDRSHIALSMMSLVDYSQ